MQTNLFFYSCKAGDEVPRHHFQKCLGFLLFFSLHLLASISLKSSWQVVYVCVRACMRVCVCIKGEPPDFPFTSPSPLQNEGWMTRQTFSTVCFLTLDIVVC